MILMVRSFQFYRSYRCQISGHKVFINFLCHEGAQNAADFYYACKSAHTDPSKVNISLMEQLYQRFIRPNSIDHLRYLTEDTRRMIKSKLDMLKSCLRDTRDQHVNVSFSIFDKAHTATMEFLTVKHAAFVQSDEYIRAVQRAQNGISPNINSSNGSSNGSSIFHVILPSNCR